MKTPHLPTSPSAVCGMHVNELPDILVLSFLVVAKENPNVQKNWMHPAGCAGVALRG